MRARYAAAVPAPSTLALFALAAIALIAIPGPNMLFVAAQSMSGGRRTGFAAALGLLTGTLIYVAAAAAGVAAIIASSALAFDALRYLGAAYLIYLGVKAWRKRDEPTRRRRVSPGRAYRQAIVVQLLNPKVALFFLAFLPQFVDPDRGPVATQVLVFGAILGALGLAMDCCYALLASVRGEALQRPEPLVRRRLHRARRRRRIDGKSSLILEGDNLAASARAAGRDARRWSTPTRRSTPAAPRPAARSSPRARRSGDRTGFGGRRYTTKLLAESSYRDEFDDYLGFLAPRLEEIRRVLHPTGTLYLHLDYREAHYVKLLLDELYGRECFLNELIWAYDYGAKPQGPLAAEARHDPRLRQGPGRLLLRLRRRRPRAVHGARPGHAGEGGEGQAAR